jgi:HEAT repeat protein
MTDNIIQFDVQERLLAKVRGYIYGVDKLIREGDEAIDVLLRAYPLAEDDLKIKIVLLLGTLASPAVVDPLLTIMRNDADSEAIRQASAIQLSVVGGVLRDCEPLVHQLLEVLQGSSTFERANAAFALGWQGNLQAVPFLIDCLFDTETEVQQAAVNALSNIQDDRLFSILTDRLHKSSKEQQRSILYNLGQFSSRYNEIVQICKNFLFNRDSDLRYDALVVLNTVADPNESLTLLEKCLNDPDARIRERALTTLTAADHHLLTALEPEVRKLLIDNSTHVRRAAIRLIHHMSPTAVVQSQS